MDSMTQHIINNLGITIANLQIEKAQLEAKLYLAEVELAKYRVEQTEGEVD